jgi:hypothetical protein
MAEQKIKGKKGCILFSDTALDVLNKDPYDRPFYGIDPNLAFHEHRSAIVPLSSVGNLYSRTTDIKHFNV